jgi:hypothetical protein
MSEEAQVLQLWVRTDKARVYGPLSPTSIELLLDNGVIAGAVQISIDGQNYVYPGRMPGVRMVFPKDLWGKDVVEGTEADAAFSQVVLPPPLPNTAPGAAAAAPAGGPRGPTGAAPRGPVAGPVMGRQPAPPQRQPMAPGTRVGPAIRPPTPQAPAKPTTAGGYTSSSSGLRQVPATSASLFDDVPSAPTAPAPRAPVTSSASVLRPAVAPAPSAPFASRPSTASAPPQAPAAPSRPAPIAEGAAADIAVPEAPGAGSLDIVSALRLYGLCAAGEANALLTLHLSDRTIAIHFKKGAPDFVDSTHPEDSLQAFLLASGLATPQQIGLADAQKARFGGELLPALFGLGLLNPSMAFQQLTERAALLIYKALTAERGTFTLEQVELPGAKAMPLGNKWSVYLEQLRRVPSSDVRRRVNSVFDAPVMRANSWARLSDLKLQPQEVRALNSFDGAHSLADSLLESPLDAEVVIRTAWMLANLELVSFSGADLSAAPTPPPDQPFEAAPAPAPVAAAVPGPPPRAVAPGPPPGATAPKTSVPYPQAKPRPPPPVVAAPAPVIAAPVAPPAPARPVITPQGAAVKPPAAAAPARPPVAAPAAAPARPPVAPAPAAPPISPSAELKDVLALLEKMKTQNFLEVLGVPRDADAGKVKIAYFKLAKSYHPDTVPPGSAEALAQAKADIFALIGEANRTLSDATLKADYLAELDAGGKKGEKVDITQLLQAEEFFQRGQVLVKNRKYVEAVKALDDAIKANDKEGEYYGWRGWAKYFTIEDKSKAHIDAMRDIEASLKTNPNAAAVHYFHGFLWKLKGDLAKAKASFKKCVELDSRHIDAQRELRTMAGK